MNTSYWFRSKGNFQHLLRKNLPTGMIQHVKAPKAEFHHKWETHDPVSNWFPMDALEVIIRFQWKSAFHTMTFIKQGKLSDQLIRIWGQVSIGWSDCPSQVELLFTGMLQWPLLKLCTVKPLIQTTPNIITQMFLISCYSCLCLIHWSQMLSREWRCSWSSADRRCSNYIWVINNFIGY